MRAPMPLVSALAHPIRIGVAQPDFVAATEAVCGPRTWQALSKAFTGSTELTGALMAPLLEDPAHARLSQLIEATSAMPGGTELGNGYAAMLYVREHLDPQPYFVVADTLVELLEQTDLTPDIPLETLKLPFPRMYLELGSSRTLQAKLPNVMTGLHALEGAYCETGVHPEFGEGLYLMFTGSPLGKADPLDDATLGLFFPQHDGKASLVEAVHASFRRSAKLAHELTLVQTPDYFETYAVGCLLLVMKALLYIGLPEARRTWRPERQAALCALSAKKSTAKQAKGRRRVASLRDYTLIEAAPAHLAGSQVAETGRGVRTHWRRGHYRMQPHGPASSLRKLLFVQPMLVAAGQDPGPPHPTYLVR